MKLYKDIRIDLYNIFPMPMLETQQNNIGRGVEITLTADSSVVDPSDEEVKMYCKKPDGTLSYLACSVVNGKIRTEFTNQMLAVPGIIQVELQIISGTDEITTPIFTLKVNPSNIDSEAIESQNEFTALQQTLSEVAYLKANGLKGDPGEAATLQIGTVTASAPGSDPVVTNSGTDQNAILNFVLPRGKQGPTGPPISTVDPSTATEEDTGKAADAYDTGAALKKVQSMISTDEYDQSKPYAVGDYCIYENALYKCITAATGVWDETKWKKTAVGTELSEQNVKLNASYTKEGLIVNENVSIVNGGYAKIGNLIIVNVRLNVTSTITYPSPIISGFPSYSGLTSLALGNNKSMDITLNNEGACLCPSNIPTGTLILSGCYIPD